jgi:2'-5' RNA ligase
VTGRSTPPASERLFFAIWPSLAVRKEIVAYRQTLHGARGRRLADGSLHLTLLFLGRVSTERRAVLATVASSLHAAPFALTLDRCGWWPRSGVLWLAPSLLPEALCELQTGLTAGARQCGLKIDTCDYSPHLSLYRDVTHVPEPLPPPAIRWPVRDFALVRSETRPDGAQYNVLQRWQLQVGSE